MTETDCWVGIVGNALSGIFGLYLALTGRPWGLLLVAVGGICAFLCFRVLHLIRIGELFERDKGGES